MTTFQTILFVTGLLSLAAAGAGIPPAVLGVIAVGLGLWLGPWGFWPAIVVVVLLTIGGIYAECKRTSSPGYDANWGS